MKKAVVIVHGLYMSTFAMKLVEHRFKKLGYKTYNFGYHTRQYSEQTLKQLHSFCNRIKESNVLFLGHSLGGLVIYDYFLHYKPQFMTTKIVTMGTPFKGSRIVKSLGKSPLAPMLFGNRKTKPLLHSGIHRPLPSIPVGIITGTLNLGVGRLFGIDDGDGTVTHQESDLQSATDKVEVHTNHLGLIYSKHAVELADRFFVNNHF